MFYFISPVESIDLDFFSWLRKIEIISHYGKSKLVNVGQKKRLTKKILLLWQRWVGLG